MEADGISFKSRSDTEVVLQLLESEGLSGLARLNGQFALAWWDPVDRRLTLVRDRFGVRPLFFATTDDGGLVFGSEAKALFASGEIAPNPTTRDSTRCSRSGARGHRGRSSPESPRSPPED